MRIGIVEIGVLRCVYVYGNIEIRVVGGMKFAEGVAFAGGGDLYGGWWYTIGVMKKGSDKMRLGRNEHTTLNAFILSERQQTNKKIDNLKYKKTCSKSGMLRLNTQLTSKCKPNKNKHIKYNIYSNDIYYTRCNALANYKKIVYTDEGIALYKDVIAILKQYNIYYTLVSDGYNYTKPLQYIALSNNTRLYIGYRRDLKNTLNFKDIKKILDI